VKRLLYHMVAHRFQEIACGSKQPLVGGVEWPGFGHRSVAVAVDHDQHALRQIAEIIGEVAVQTADNRPMGKIAIAAERQLPQHKISHRIHPIGVDQLFRRDNVAE